MLQSIHLQQRTMDARAIFIACDRETKNKSHSVTVSDCDKIMINLDDTVVDGYTHPHTRTVSPVFISSSSSCNASVILTTDDNDMDIDIEGDDDDVQLLDLTEDSQSLHESQSMPSVLLEVGNEANSSLVNDAVVKHENSCEDDLDSTIAICNVFNSEQEEETLPNESENANSFIPSSESELILITDLDSMSSHVKSDPEMEEKVNFSLKLESDCEPETEKERPCSRSDSSCSPQILLLDLQCQEDYITEILKLNRGCGSRTTESNESVETKDDQRNDDEIENIFTASKTKPAETQSNQKYYFAEETMFDMSDEKNDVNQYVESYSPNFFKDSEPYHSRKSPQVLFHDLNDYEPLHSKPQIKNGQYAEHDSFFYLPENYYQNQNKCENKTVRESVSPNNSLDDSHSNVCGDCFEFSTNDSGFFDSSYVGASSMSFDKGSSSSCCRGSPDFSSMKKDKMYDVSMKFKSDGSYFESLASGHENMSTNSSKMTSFTHKSDTHLFGDTGPPLFFATNSIPSLPTLPKPIPYKQPVLDSSMSYQYPYNVDLSESSYTGSSVFPEWMPWINGPCQEQGIRLPQASQSFSNTPASQAPKSACYDECKELKETTIYHNDFLKPSGQVDNDSEETDDADEISGPSIYDMPNNFVSRYEYQQLPQPTNSYDSLSVPQLGNEGITPLPLQPSSISTIDSGANSSHSPSSLHLNSNYNTDMRKKVDAAFKSYELGLGPKLPYPSMADMMRSSRFNASKSNAAVKQLIAQSVTQGQHYRKNQIQSDAISTSTAKSPRYKRKTPNCTVSAPKRKSIDVGPMSINLNCLERDKHNSNIRRHNEPLKTHAISIMSRWYEEHLDNPYPTKEDKVKMAAEGGVSVTQVRRIFISH